MIKKDLTKEEALKLARAEKIKYLKNMNQLGGFDSPRVEELWGNEARAREYSLKQFIGIVTNFAKKYKVNIEDLIFEIAPLFIKNLDKYWTEKELNDKIAYILTFKEKTEKTWSYTEIQQYTKLYKKFKGKNPKDITAD